MCARVRDIYCGRAGCARRPRRRGVETLRQNACPRWRVSRREIFGLLGPNGAGKTTLIRTILDLIKPDSGRVEINLADIKRQYSTDTEVRVLSSADYSACPLVARVDRNGSPNGAVQVHLREGAGADAFLHWLVASGARIDSFERLSTPLEEIFVHVAQGAV